MPHPMLRQRITLLTASVLGMVSCSTAATTGTTVQDGPTVGPASTTSPATPTAVPDSVSIIDGIAYGRAVDHRGEEIELLLDPPPEPGVEPLPPLSAVVSNGATLKAALGVLDVAR